MVSSKVEAMRLQLIIRPACSCNAIYENTLPCTHAMLALAAFERTCSVALAGAGIISLAVVVTSLMRAGACGISAALSKVARWCCQPFCGLLRRRLALAVFLSHVMRRRLALAASLRQLQHLLRRGLMLAAIMQHFLRRRLVLAASLWQLQHLVRRGLAPAAFLRHSLRRRAGAGSLSVPHYKAQAGAGSLSIFTF